MLTTLTLSPVCKAYYDRMLLEHLTAQFWHLRFADPGRVITLKPGEYLAEFRRWSKLAPATTPLTEGVTPPGNSTTVTTLQVTPAQYGDWVPHSDRISMTSIDPVVTSLIDLLKVQAAETIDIVSRDKLAQGTSVQYANGKASRGLLTATDVFDTEEIDLAVRTLERASVPKFEDEFGGSYIAFVHPDCKFDLRKDTKYQSADNYAGSIKQFSGELGRWNGVRLIANAMAKKFVGAGAAGVDVFATLVFGKHWYGTVKWTDKTGGVATATDGGQMVEVFVKPLGSGDDPLHQRGSIGWKTSHICEILNQTCGVRIETGATA